MQEVTKADINRIYDKIDPMSQAIARIETKLCAHLKAHDKIGGPIIGALVDLVKMAVVAAVTYVLVK